jgi:hypothetical protein
MFTKAGSSSCVCAWILLHARLNNNILAFASSIHNKQTVQALALSINKQNSTGEATGTGPVPPGPDRGFLDPPKNVMKSFIAPTLIDESTMKDDEVFHLTGTHI